jgi:asparagine synthase (glutamine-hydrolysing)
MCGIAGFAIPGKLPDPAPARLAAMCASLRHRGPDDEGRDIRDGVALGMRRLSVIDLAGGAQPMFNEDRSVRVVFNGEIYNFRELRRELSSRGHAFRTNADTEVIVHAYEEWGGDFPARFNGMFAFALHDANRRRLLLARDHAGIKPLYVAHDGGRIIWGSEIKALLASGLVDRSLDMDALGEFLAWEYVPGRRTLFRGISKLLPGEVMEVDLDDFSVRMRIYWDVPPSSGDFRRDPEEWIEAVDGKIRECVRRQLVSDVPLGAFLSGGVDSSLIVAAMGKAKAFSIGFDDPSYNELEWAARVAGHLGVPHVTETIRPDVEGLFHRLLHFLDDPIGDFSIFPTYLVSALARRHVTVALSGDGGDELFGGYETYVADGLARRYGRLPAFLRTGLIEPAVRKLRPRPVKKGLVNKARRFVEGLAHDPELGHARWRIYAGDGSRTLLFTDEALAAMEVPAGFHIRELFRRAGDRHPLDRSLYVDLKSYLCDDILVKVDRMSMAASLEARVPYLDPEMISLAFGMPDALKVSAGRTKILLKEVAARHVPRDCVFRPKEGFSVPIKNWLAEGLRPLLEEFLDERAVAREGLFRAETVGRMKREHLAGRENHSHVLWTLMVFHAWRRLWLEGPIRPIPAGVGA